MPQVSQDALITAGRTSRVLPNPVGEHDGKLIRFIQSLVMMDDSKTRRAWNIMLFMCLFYTGTIMPFRLAFIEFAMPEPLKQRDGWVILEICIDTFFWMDLLVSFFCTYRGVNGREVVDIRLISCTYFRHFFFLNLVACLPPELVGLVINGLTQDAGSREKSSVNKTVRMTRLQRMSRLARLVRLARMTKLVRFFLESSMIQYIRSLRGIRIMNFLCGLLWVVHLTACLWYICAALHEDQELTWVGTRCTENNGLSVCLLDQGPGHQWVHSMYFVLTVFTTVGFGDISASTLGEMLVVMIIMIIGAVVNGIVLSEVINLITSADMTARAIIYQKQLIEDFAAHTTLDDKMKRCLTDWVEEARSHQHNYNREEMKDLITGLGLPLALTGRLPKAMFEGKLVKNAFVTLSMASGGGLLERLPVLVALAVNTRQFDAGEVVYNRGDHAFNLFLVLSGVFAAVAQRVDSGLVEMPSLRPNAYRWDELDKSRVAALENCVPYRLFCFGTYFGEAELLLPGARPRITSMRCEGGTGRDDRTDGKGTNGELLVMHKRELASLGQEFPQAWRVWRSRASSSESHRRSPDDNSSYSSNHYDFAASVIQRHWRSERRKRDAHAIGLADIVDAANARQVSAGADNLSKLRADVDGVTKKVDKVQCDVSIMNEKLDAILHMLRRSSEQTCSNQKIQWAAL